jgi:hypothetical protein
MSERIHAMVSNAHGDIDFVRAALAEDPTLANCAWNWGDGDWETALGAAGHMGRRDIAELLLAHGARLDVFVAAMLGELAIVETMLNAYPAMRDANGPHGISLLRHAEAGGAEAQAVVELLTRG